MQVPKIGDIGLYTLSEHDAGMVNKRREDARQSGIARQETGAVVHFGNGVQVGDVFPLVITRVWDDGTIEARVNGQVLLDGNDSLWVTSVKQSDGGEPCSYRLED